jgi:tripartite-type tricarboxylate transporter receptor subunit TctC
MKRLHALAAAASVLLACSPAFALDYPIKPVRLLVGFPAGSSTDAAARAISGRLGEGLGQQVIVDNRPGAAGNIAAEITARARADGYTLLLGANGALAVNPALYRGLGYDPVRDFSPVTLVVQVTNVLVVNPSVPANSVSELIALAKNRSLNCGSGGVGTPGHLALELFNRTAGTNIVHVGYKGSGVALVDLIAGQIQLIFATAATALPQMKAGRVKALAVTGRTRSALLPDLPTVAESGLKDFDVTGWYGVVAPAGTPRAIVNRLNADILRALETPDVKQALVNQGFDLSPSTPEAFGAYLKSEIAKWGKVVRDAGIKAES